MGRGGCMGIPVDMRRNPGKYEREAYGLATGRLKVWVESAKGPFTVARGPFFLQMVGDPAMGVK